MLLLSSKIWIILQNTRTYTVSWFLSISDVFSCFVLAKNMKQTEVAPKVRGGTTCCVLQCTSNTVKNKNLSFHQFPVEFKTKEKWLDLLGIQKQPLKSLKVCSLHFPGEKKVLNALPTAAMPSYRQTKSSSQMRMSSKYNTKSLKLSMLN